MRIKSSTHYYIYTTKRDVTVTEGSYILRDTDVNASSPLLIIPEPSTAFLLTSCHEVVTVALHIRENSK